MRGLLTGIFIACLSTVAHPEGTMQDRDWQIEAAARLKGLPEDVVVDLGDAAFTLSNSRNPNPTRVDNCKVGPSPTNPYPLQLLGSPNVQITGAKVNGKVPLGSDWLWAYCNSAAIRVADSPGARVTGARIRGAWDAIRISSDSESFRIDASWISAVRDDCVENDYLQSGEVRDVLFDGCFSGISVAPTKRGSGKMPVVRLTGVLLRMQPFLYRNRVRHALPIKYRDAPVELVIRDSVIAVETADQVGQRHAGEMWQSVSDCSNNLFLWLGSGPLPPVHRPPQSCFRVMTGPDARLAWTKARRNWNDCHPGIGRFPDDPASRAGHCRTRIFGGFAVENNEVHSGREQMGNRIAPAGKTPAKGRSRAGPDPSMYNLESGRSE